MSNVANVLMGIAGGMMTIGLATAGGSYIAPDFNRARVTADAAQVLTAVRQTGAAVTMARTLDGDVPVGIEGVRELVRSGWLSSIPTNPTSDQPAGAPAVMPAPDGSKYVQMPLIGDMNGELCDTVAKLAGLGRAPTREVAPLVPAGCVRTSSGSIAFVRS